MAEQDAEHQGMEHEDAPPPNLDYDQPGQPPAEETPPAAPAEPSAESVSDTPNGDFESVHDHS